jgi:hypothetical protein
MWKVFNTGGVTWGTANAIVGGDNLTSIAGSKHIVVLGHSANGMTTIDFMADTSYAALTLGTGYGGQYAGNLAQANDGLGTLLNNSTIIVNNTVNAVALTYQPDAPIVNGVPVPTIIIGCDPSASVITHDGDVWDLTSAAGGAFGNSDYVGFTPQNEVVVAMDNSSRPNYFYGPIPTADVVIADANNRGQNGYRNLANPVAGFATTDYLPPLGPTFNVGQFAAQGKNVEYFGTNAWLAAYIRNEADPLASLGACITDTWNGGYWVGDIRRCYLANSKTADRSVKAGALVENGTVTETVNAGGRNVYSGFSAANYFSEASHADWNALGTGDFSIIMSGVKWGTAGGARCLVSMGDGVSAGSISVYLSGTNLLRTAIHNGTSFTFYGAASPVYTDTAEHTVEIKRVSGVLYQVVDGVAITSDSTALTISNSTGGLQIGEAQDSSYPLTGGQIACVRISATAPTAEQSLFIAQQENALNDGALCLLSNSASVSALAYDASTDVYSVGNGTNVDQFKGLQRLSSAAHGVTTLTALASGAGEKLVVGTGGTYSRPALDLYTETKALRLKLSQEQNKRQVYTFTSSGTTQKVKQGWKPVSPIIDITTGTGVIKATTTTFDGFVYTLTGLTTAKDYIVDIERW